MRQCDYPKVTCLKREGGECPFDHCVITVIRDEPKKCECRGAAIRTVVIASDAHYKCPRCGGLIDRPKKEKT